MVEWSTLRSRFPKDEIEEIDRIKDQYGLSYNEIIRSGVKFYVGLTLAKELIADTLEDKDILVGGVNITEILKNPKYQRNIEQSASKIVKILILEFFEKGMDFKEKTKTLRKERKVGRPKTKKNKS